jgi:hypothetical protein
MLNYPDFHSKYLFITGCGDQFKRLELILRQFIKKIALMENKITHYKKQAIRA